MKKISPMFLYFIFLTIFAWFVMTGRFLVEPTLFMDVHHGYSLFRDNLHSLNHFGEIAWWFPHNQFGWPGYYSSILGLHIQTPIFALLGFLSWLLGKLNIHFSSFYYIYLAYLSFMSLFPFFLGVFLLAREVFQSRVILFFIMTLAAFSPGATLSFGMLGYLENITYGLYFAAAYLYFIKSPTRFSFAVLCFTSLLLAISLSYCFLIWNIIIIPVFLVCVSFIPRQNFEKVKKAFSSIPLYHWVLFFIFVVLCFLPNAITFSQTGDLVKTKFENDRLFYPLRNLQSGYPLEMLIASLPGFSFYLFDWFHYTAPNWVWNGGHFYLGLLCSPLATIGLLFGRYPFRLYLFLMLTAVFAIVVLSARSPIFASILIFPTPLRAMNHYGDIMYKAGSFLLLLFSAALGLETILKKEASTRWLLLGIFWLFSFLSILVFFVTYGREVVLNLIFELLVVLSFLFSVVLVWLARAKDKNHLKGILACLIFLTLVDVSTNTFIYVRRSFGGSPVDETPNANLIGMKDEIVNIDSDRWISYKQLFHMKRIGLDPQEFPQFKLFTQAHSNEDMTQEKARIKESGFDGYTSLVLPEGSSKIDVFKPFFKANSVTGIKVGGDTEILRQTYNDLDLKVSANEKSLLFVRDAYSPYWKAKINGERVPITRALYNFKAVVVPAGISTVTFHFSPPWVGVSIAIAYFIIFAVGFWCLYLWRKTLAIQ